MDEQQLSQNQADARRLCLPRIVWQAMPYRVVEWYSEDDDRIHLALERWDGDDRMGQSRWQVVADPYRYDDPTRYDAASEAVQRVAAHWANAFWALATPLFVAHEEAERRRAEDERRQRRLDQMDRYDPF